MYITTRKLTERKSFNFSEILLNHYTESAEIHSFWVVSVFFSLNSGKSGRRTRAQVPLTGEHRKSHFSLNGTFLLNKNWITECIFCYDNLPSFPTRLILSVRLILKAHIFPQGLNNNWYNVFMCPYFVVTIPTCVLKKLFIPWRSTLRCHWAFVPLQLKRS